MRFDFIEQHARTFPVRLMCSVLGVSASGYYAWRSSPDSARAIANWRLLQAVQRLHARHRLRYSSPRVHGFHGFFPRALAALMPACVRSEISERSSCATASRTCKEKIPYRIAVSIGLRRERKYAFLASNVPMTSGRWLTERPS